MTYRIEYQDLATSEYCWRCCEGIYSSSDEAQRAINELIALRGAWSRCAYRVRPIQKTAPTNAELVRLVERLSNEGVELAIWFGEDGAEAVLFEEDEIAAAVPGGPVRRGWVFDRPIKAVVRELVAGDHEAVAQARAAAVEAQERAAVQERERERERAAAAAQQRAAAQERERAAAAAVEAQQRAAAQERQRVATQERERAEAHERERVAKQERERAEAQQRALAAAEERERVAGVEAQQRAAALDRERAVAIEAQRRAAALDRERAAAVEAQQRAAAVEAQQRAAAAERERAVAIEAQQRAAALAREHAAAVERERAAAEARQRAAKQDRERAAAVEAQRRAAAQERERVALLQPSVEATRARSTGPVAIPQSIAAAVQRPPLARVAEPQPVARVAQGSPVARAARSAFVPRLPTSPNLDSEGELVALAKLLRCGAWREGMRANDLLTAEQLPAGAHRAIQELVGTATLNVRALGNALKRVQDKRIDGITLKLKRKIDNHGFAIWQVVNDPAAASTTSERPSKAELLRGALTGMGYRLAEANHAISALRDCVETESLADLVRKALGVLGQRPSAGSEGKRK